MDRPRGRPREAVLDAERITDAAYAVLRREGARGLTMRAIAARLDVAPSALYHHLPSRAAILAAVQERFAAGLDTSGFGTLPLREALSRWAWSYLRQLREHPELVPVIVEVPLAQTPHTSLMYQRVIAGYAAAGWPEESIIASMSVLETYIFGAALDSPSPDDVYAPRSSAQEPLLARTYAAFAASVDDQGERPRDALFRLGVESILTGLYSVWGSGRGWAATQPPTRAGMRATPGE